MENEKFVGSIATEIEACDEGYRVIMRVFSPQGVEHSRKDMIAETREEATMAASFLRGVAIDHGMRVGSVH